MAKFEPWTLEDPRVISAIKSLGDITAAEYEQYLKDERTLATEMTAEQRARWTALDERLGPLNEAWVQVDDFDNPEHVWTGVLLAVLRERDESRAVIAEIESGKCDTRIESSQGARNRGKCVVEYARARLTKAT